MSQRRKDYYRHAISTLFQGLGLMFLGSWLGEAKILQFFGILCLLVVLADIASGIRRWFR